MFSGIIETVGTVSSILRNGTNITLQIESPIAEELKIDQSIAHNGVCLTVETILGGAYTVTAIKETLEKTNLGKLEIGSLVNLERCLTLNSLIDGHLVQGHVDCVGSVVRIVDENGSHVITISYPDKFSHLIIEKGSITINGTSLTAFNLYKNQFSVAIIPYTWTHTMLHQLINGDEVNLEFDLIGKYLSRRLEVTNE